MSEAQMVSYLTRAMGKKAPEMTHMLAALGGGSMEKGLKVLARHYFKAGVVKGKGTTIKAFLVGIGLTLCAGALVFGFIDWLKSKKELTEEDEQILDIINKAEEELKQADDAESNSDNDIKADDAFVE